MIKDGTGKGFRAKVNSNHKLLVDADIRSILASRSNRLETAFSLSSDFIALTTTASFSGILYLQNNNSVDDIMIHQIRTSGTVVQEWKAVRNPTAGTLISAGVAKTPRNLHFGSSNTLTATSKAGTDAQTVTDGDEFDHWINGIGKQVLFFDGGLILPSNQSIALLCKPIAAGDVVASLLVTAVPIGSDE